eukprot:TRINITY_DN4308_c0_g1_i1.p1 TRINITY_DN4308_c0_g1~~TRINITY_DN4308_c0_g1_i1.p1  ORF type:complete len:375 (+),score=112.72 TRINITY_DN4308_c0_g1_i1:845-1969(+)
MPRPVSDMKDDPEDCFEMGETIGQGSYGTICTCRNVREDKVYAIKFLEIDEEDQDDSLQKEIDILKESRPCPYVVKYYGCFQKESTLMIIMEFCDGGSAQDILKASKQNFEEDQIASLIAQMVQGLVYLHSNRILHRDIKAGNVLLTCDGRAKLADFGVSAKMSQTGQKRVTMVGSPYWMAPEVISLKNKEGYDYKSDIWSLGITAIELAEGKPPLFDVAAMRVIFVIPARDPPTLKDPKKWSSDFVDFVSTCLQKDQNKRPSSSDLVSHPFVQKGLKLESTDLLKELVQETLPKLKIMRAKSGESDSEDEDSDEGTSGTFVSGTMVTVNRNAGTFRSGTKSLRSDGGTTVFNDVEEGDDDDEEGGSYGTTRFH